jgi:hypothetical protein
MPSCWRQVSEFDTRGRIIKYNISQLLRHCPTPDSLMYVKCRKYKGTTCSCKCPVHSTVMYDNTCECYKCYLLSVHILSSLCISSIKSGRMHLQRIYLSLLKIIILKFTIASAVSIHKLKIYRK